jgi:hypothetical protein
LRSTGTRNGSAIASSITFERPARMWLVTASRSLFGQSSMVGWYRMLWISSSRTGRASPEFSGTRLSSSGSMSHGLIRSNSPLSHLIS